MELYPINKKELEDIIKDLDKMDAFGTTLFIANDNYIFYEVRAVPYYGMKRDEKKELVVEKFDKNQSEKLMTVSKEQFFDIFKYMLDSFKFKNFR